MVFPNQAISYIAVVPKRTGYAPSGGSLTYNQQRTQGRNPLPSKLSSGTGVALTDDHWWDLSAIRDAQDTANYTLDKTFYKIVSGVTSLTIPNNTNGSGKVVDIGYTFKDAPHIIATIGKGTTDTTVANTNGLVKISAFAKSPNTGTGSVYSGSSFATKTWDMHKQFAIRGFNHSGASVTINVNWIAIGLTQ